MGFSLDRVVPWGRSFSEYQRMFALTERDKNLRILGCADGPSSFNAEAADEQMEVVSIDPIYRFTSAEIRHRIDVTYPVLMEQTREHFALFNWNEFGTVEGLGRARMKSMNRFLEHYDASKESERYLPAELPSLSFQDRFFDLALCSHFLFLYSDHLDLNFHIASIVEMCRVASEARVFPLITLEGAPSPHLRPVTEALQRDGFVTKTETVSYEFQQGGNEMMRIWPKCR